jgi:hypothetical protein
MGCWAGSIIVGAVIGDGPDGKGGGFAAGGGPVCCIRGPVVYGVVDPGVGLLYGELGVDVGVATAVVVYTGVIAGLG